MSDNKPPNLGKDAIVAMWIAVAIIDFGVALSTIENNNPLGWPFVLPILVAFLGTLIIWTTQLPRERYNKQSAQGQEKPKREAGDMMALLMELMDEDERAAFKQKLQERVLRDAGYGEDGEIPDQRVSLETLMHDEDADSLRH